MDANIQDAFGMTPLMWAAQAGDTEMTTMILQMRVPLDVLSSDGKNASHIAILHHQEDVAVVLVDQKNLDVNALATGERGVKRVTPLMLAVEREELKVVQKLLTRSDTEQDGCEAATSFVPPKMAMNEFSTSLWARVECGKGAVYAGVGCSLLLSAE